ncbi:PQQ-dependent sugar dehydrogenase [Hufsiella ginkgonis]|uniref:Carbohydrate-binding protein n=1 Tax=Hufsiella ginkgonis TaxID=2695274 RepID=A0A7K1XU27_9SPHI|nr:PQQ-dependent sugar dehydrogenase [Hufsiella ginkgonis]MXV14482.1 carbohydrate-binding protein [Hufsiella ginkgonis]
MYLRSVVKGVCLLFLTAAGSPAFSQALTKPADNRFTKVVLVQRLEEPMQFQVMKDGRVIYAERKGKIKVYDPATGQLTLVAQFPVSTTYKNKQREVTEGEDGLQGIILDPDYDTNHWLYIYYSLAGNDPKNVLVRYEWYGKELIAGSRKVMLEVVTQREECCHVGGGMLFDKHKNLFLTTGDNTFSRASDGYTPLDEQPGQSPRDAQKSSGNTNDLRGKILRIHPEPDGTYSIPEGNLFPKEEPLTRPEIYTMGNRNPWRPSIDSKTGWLYWGEVGPDGSDEDMEKRGPRSHDEFNLAKKPGNYGWPYFVGNNKPYVDYDFATKTSGKPFDPAQPVNDSPNNTGRKALPPAVPALVWYSKNIMPEFPLMESGGNSAVGGPVFRAGDFGNARRVYPAYYEGKWFITDWVRGWLNVVEVDEQGNYRGMERFLPGLHLKGPIDMKFGPEGDLYVLEYGNGYFKDNPEAELIRIEYNGGNRKPEVQAAATKTAGAVPLKISLSAAGTKDYDEGDSLRYEWKITRNGAAFKTMKQATPSVTFTAPGTYRATLTVTDSKGAKNSKSVEIKAGNEPPVVGLKITSGNSRFFFPGKTITYAVSVTDKEDGSLANKRIMPAQVSVSANYLSEGYNPTVIAQQQLSFDAAAQHAGARSMINKSDCKACHQTTGKSLGPAFTAVALRYRNDAAAVEKLAKKVISGGSGVWGDAQMPAHPALSASNAQAIVKYVLSLGTPAKVVRSLPVTGAYTTNIPQGEGTEGSFIIRAAYTDRGAKTISAQTGEKVVVLQPPVLKPSKADEAGGFTFNADSTLATVRDAGGYLKFSKLDLTGIGSIAVITEAGSRQATGKMIEVRSGSPEGPLLGTIDAKQGSPGTAITGNLGTADLYLVFPGPMRIRSVRLGPAH